MSNFSLKLELESGRLVLLDVKGFPIPRQWSVVVRKGKRLSRVAQHFLDFLTQPIEQEMQESGA